MAATFQDFIGKERERLTKAREDALAKRQAADDEITAIDSELRAISAYEAAKTGKPPAAPVPTERKTRRGPTPGTPRAPRGAKRQEVLDLLGEHPDGLSRSEIVGKLGKVDNVLQALKKENKVDNKDGKWIAA